MDYRLAKNIVPNRRYRSRLQFYYEHDGVEHPWIQEKKGTFNEAGVFQHSFMVPYRCKYRVTDAKGQFVAFKRAVVTVSKLIGSVNFIVSDDSGPLNVAPLESGIAHLLNMVVTLDRFQADRQGRSRAEEEIQGRRQISSIAVFLHCNFHVTSAKLSRICQLA